MFASPLDNVIVDARFYAPTVYACPPCVGEVCTLYAAVVEGEDASLSASRVKTGGKSLESGSFLGSIDRAEGAVSRQPAGARGVYVLRLVGEQNKR